MVLRPQVPDNLRHLQRQINARGTARPGPISIGPDDGHIRIYDAAGNDLISMSSDDVRIRHRGGLVSLPPLLEGYDTSITGHDARLTNVESKNSAQDSRLDTLHSRQNSADQTNATQNGQISQLRVDLTNESARIDNRATIGQLDATNTRVTNVESKNSTQDTRLTNVESKNSTQDTRLTNVEARNTAQDGRIDTLHSRANSQDTLNATQNGQISQLQKDVQTARNRADDAYSLAAGRASDGDVSAALATAKQYTDSRINALVGALRNAGIDFIF